MEIKMIKLLKDNTTNTFFTRCKVCRSEFEYSYEDVEFESIPYLAIPTKKILCPACGKETTAELVTKENYDSAQDNNFPFLPASCGVPEKN
jgi:hypothetical protein